MGGATAFSVEEFVAEPALGKLNNVRKADLFAIADHYGIQVSASLLKKDLKAAVVDGLVERGGCSLPATGQWPWLSPRERSTPHPLRGAEATEPQDILNMTPSANRGDRDAKQFTLPHFGSLSVETTPGSRIDARLKLRLARLQLEMEEREREFQLRRELELKRLEAAVKMRELELQSSSASSGARSSVSSGTFDVGKNISLVPVFRESEVEGYFSAFERIAAALHWSEDVWATLLQCRLTGRAQEACSSLSVEDSLSYGKVKSTILRVYELV